MNPAGLLPLHGYFFFIHFFLRLRRAGEAKLGHIAYRAPRDSRRFFAVRDISDLPKLPALAPSKVQSIRPP
jgi:hypothetical protein